MVALVLWSVPFRHPVCLLLSRELKHQARAALGIVAGWCCFAHLVDVYWLVAPSLFHAGGCALHWLDFAAPLASAASGSPRFRARLASSHPLVPQDAPGCSPASWSKNCRNMTRGTRLRERRMPDTRPRSGHRAAGRSASLVLAALTAGDVLRFLHRGSVTLPIAQPDRRPRGSARHFPSRACRSAPADGPAENTAPSENAN